MIRLLVGWWLALWPNLVADVIAAFAAWGAHHRWTKRHTQAVHARLDAIHTRLDTLHSGRREDDPAQPPS